MMGGVDDDSADPSPPSAWSPPEVEELQELLSDYEVIELIGRGGMGAVYKARQPTLDRLVAIKVLPVIRDELGVDFVARFRNEARLMARMNHPGIVHVYDFGELPGGMCFFVMEFVAGTDVARMVKANGKLPPEHAASITAEVCAALHYAHEAGVVHRDIKPANILVSTDGQVKVADFGLAKGHDPAAGGVTGTGLTLGTPDYAAPESLISGMLVDHRADLYGVGVMLYNMLTGDVPRGVFKPVSKQVGARTSFDDIIRKAMSADREHRYQTAVAMKTAVQQATQPRMARSLRWLGIAAVAALLLVAGFALRPVMLPHEVVLSEQQAARRVAEWVFSKGGVLGVRSGREMVQVTRPEEIPTPPFVIEEMRFMGISHTGTGITGAELALWLPYVPELKRFKVEASPRILRSLDNAGLNELAKLLKLESLSLEHAPLSDDQFACLTPSTLLHLNVAHTKVLGVGLNHLRRTLVSLNVRGCPINDAGWSEIREFKRLRFLKTSNGVAPTLKRNEEGYMEYPETKSYLWPDEAGGGAAARF